MWTFTRNNVLQYELKRDPYGYIIINLGSGLPEYVDPPQVAFKTITNMETILTYFYEELDPATDLPIETPTRVILN